MTNSLELNRIIVVDCLDIWWFIFVRHCCQYSNMGYSNCTCFVSVESFTI